MDEVTDPSLTIFVEGHQYICYANNDDEEEELKLYPYFAPESDLEGVVLRMLEVYHSFISPEYTLLSNNNSSSSGKSDSESAGSDEIPERHPESHVCTHESLDP